MKPLFYILSIFLILSCEGDINDSDYLNSDYVFFSEDGKTGVWRKLKNNSNFKYDPGTKHTFLMMEKYLLKLKS